MHIRWLLMMFYSEKYICICVCVCDENLFSIKKNTHNTHIHRWKFNQSICHTVIQWRCIQDDVLTNFDYEFSILNNFWDSQKKKELKIQNQFFFMSPLVASRYSFDSDRKNYEFTHTHSQKFVSTITTTTNTQLDPKSEWEIRWKKNTKTVN